MHTINRGDKKSASFLSRYQGNYCKRNLMYKFARNSHCLCKHLLCEYIQQINLLQVIIANYLYVLFLITIAVVFGLREIIVMLCFYLISATLCAYISNPPHSADTWITFLRCRCLRWLSYKLISNRWPISLLLAR